MYYKSNLEFINYYCDNVLDDLKPMVKSLLNEIVSYERPYKVKQRIFNSLGVLLEEREQTFIKIENLPKYSNLEVLEIIKENLDKKELNKFIKIIYSKQRPYDITFIMRYYLNNYDKMYCREILELRYKEYFRNEKRYLKNKNKKYIK